MKEILNRHPPRMNGSALRLCVKCSWLLGLPVSLPTGDPSAGGMLAALVPRRGPRRGGKRRAEDGHCALLGFTSPRAGALGPRMRRGAGGGQVRRRSSGTGRRGRAGAGLHPGRRRAHCLGKGPGAWRLRGAAPEGPCPPAAHLRRL